MDHLRSEALDFYSKSSKEVKALATKFFNHLDSDGDSSINCAEFFTFIRRNKLLSRLSITFEVFEAMDRDGNDKLDFNEFITFFYVIFGTCVCDGCGVKLLGQRHMTCGTCFATKGDTFDLCAACLLSSKRFKHQHADFLDFKLLMLESVPSKSSTQSMVQDEEDVMDKAMKVLEGTLKALDVADALEVANAIASCHIM
ncbi:hypothetical protein QQ045_011613 [Rhodiola kirilowii]